MDLLRIKFVRFISNIYRGSFTFTGCIAQFLKLYEFWSSPPLEYAYSRNFDCINYKIKGYRYLGNTKYSQYTVRKPFLTLNFLISDLLVE